VEAFNLLKNAISGITIWSVLDILVISYIFYKGYSVIRQTRAEQLLKGILLILVLIPISDFLNLTMLYFILEKTITIGVLSIIIIFQPEIRNALEQLGRSAFLERSTLIENKEVMDRVITAIVTAVDNLSKSKTGALIVVEQNTGLNDYITSGTELDAKVTSALLENIFVVNTPLHDGATIIRNDRILVSGCVLPLTGRDDINKKLGTRHRAAIGLTEISDAIVVIVSEETGVISLSANGKLTRNYDKDKLKDILIRILKRRQVSRKTTIGKKVSDWSGWIKQKVKKS
jgi:diadenylate cyclase